MDQLTARHLQILARLKGIERALQRLVNLPEGDRRLALGQVARIELPFSATRDPRSQEVLNRIGALVWQLDVVWGGAPAEDVLIPREGYVNATTNTGDNHAPIGNEGGYASVDAMISSNAVVDHLNAAANEGITLVVSPPFHPGSIFYLGLMFCYLNFGRLNIKNLSFYYPKLRGWQQRMMTVWTAR